MWKTGGEGTLDFADDKLRLKEKDKCVDLTVSEGGHLLAKLELVGKWNDDEAVYLVKTERSNKLQNSEKDSQGT